LPTVIDPLVSSLLSLLVGLLLLVAGGHKLATLTLFRSALADYRLLPQPLIGAVALLIPLLECALGLAWLTGFALTLTATATAGMFTVYGLAMAVNLVRGRIHIQCGCSLGGAAGPDQRLSWWLVGRNVVLTALALAPLAPTTGRVLQSIDFFDIAAGLIAAALLYAGWLQLLANRAAIALWRDRRA